MALLGDTFYVGNTDGVVAFPYAGGRRPHHRDRAQARARSSPAGIGRAACCRAPTAGSSMPASARSATSPRTAWRSRKAAPRSTSSIWRAAAAASSPRGLRNPVGLAWEPQHRRALDRGQRARRPGRRDAAGLSDLGARRRLLRLALLLLGPDGGRPRAAGSGRWSPRRSRRTTRWAGTPPRSACAGCRPARCRAFPTAWSIGQHGSWNRSTLERLQGRLRAVRERAPVRARRAIF